MTRRRDLLGYVGACGALQLVAGKTGHAREGAARPASRARRPEPSRLASPTASIPFTHYGRAGRLAIDYGVTEDPVASGFDIVPGIPFDLALCRGYPRIQAVIESYGGSGYRGLCGWIQVITGKRYRSDSEQAAPDDTAIDVDRLPSMMEVDLPFAGFGCLPELFDAPCRNLNGFRRLQWTADTFLTSVPLRSRDEDIRRLAGFRWGYVEYDPATRRPVAPLPLAVTGADAWNGLLPFLGKTFPRWRFAAAG